MDKMMDNFDRNYKNDLMCIIDFKNIIAKIENSFIVLTIAQTEQRVNLRTNKLIIHKTEAQRQKEQNKISIRDTWNMVKQLNILIRVIEG